MMRVVRGPSFVKGPGPISIQNQEDRAMAFKKFDFSTLDTDVAARERDPYEDEDRRMKQDFKGQVAHRGAVRITLDTRTIGFDDIIMPTEVDGTRFDLIFKGQRAEDIREAILDPLAARRRAMLDAKDVADLTEADFAQADAVFDTIIVEGFWRKRWWKDGQNAWRSGLELHVAKFHYSTGPDASSFFEKGRVPETT